MGTFNGQCLGIMGLRRLWAAALLLLLSAVACNAFAFELRDTDGREQTLSAAKGQWVIVNFWATWCAPCIREIPEIAEFAKESSERVRVVGVVVDWTDTGTENKDADRRKVIAFAKKIGHSYPLVLASAASEKAFGPIAGLPRTIIYSPEGKIVYDKTATITKKTLRAVLAGEKIS